MSSTANEIKMKIIKSVLATEFIWKMRHQHKFYLPLRNPNSKSMKSITIYTFRE